LEEELQATRQDLIEKVDSYLNYVVESWMKQNELAIDTGLRTEISEDFMNKLKNLFVESYIEVPESKIDLVDELADQVETLESKLDEQTQQVMEMTRMLEQHQRDAIVRDASRDLAETQVSKLITLVESLDFESAETFAKKVKTVKESYFKKAVKQEEQITEEEWETAPQVTGLMEQYLSAIKKTSK
jgi:paraquat-inducible protein B